MGGAEQFLEEQSGIDLIVAAQAYQWMDRPRYLRAAAGCLSVNGVVAIMQNNRDFTLNRFLDSYESLLEQLSPGYSRFYRAFDIEAELTGTFHSVGHATVVWEQPMRSAEFAAMTRTSTQVQRALSAHGGEFERRLDELLAAHESDGHVVVTYTSEAFTGSHPVGTGL